LLDSLLQEIFKGQNVFEIPVPSVQWLIVK